MSKISRRKMFGFAAAAPFAIGVMANSKPAVASTIPTKDMKDAPDTSIITLQRQEMQNRSVGDSNIFTVTGFKSVGPQLHISVGKDGYMWLKINDEWKKVVVE